MALVANGVRLSASPMRQMGAASAGSQHQSLNPGARRNAFFSEASVSGVTVKSGIPNGYRHPSAWIQPQKAGSLGSYGLINGRGDLSGTIAGGKNGTALLTGSGALSAAGQLVVSAAATLSGSGAITLADLRAYLNAAASLAGAGSLSGTAGAVGHASATLAGVGSCTGVRYAVGHMSAEITPFTELSPQNLAAAVWNALTSQFSATGTMGEAMSTAGSGGLSPAQQTMLEELHKLAGLDTTKPLVVTATSRKVPADGSDISQSISDVAGTVTVTRS